MTRDSEWHYFTCKWSTMGDAVRKMTLAPDLLPSSSECFAVEYNVGTATGGVGTHGEDTVPSGLNAMDWTAEPLTKQAGPGYECGSACPIVASLTRCRPSFSVVPSLIIAELSWSRGMTVILRQGYGGRGR